MSRYFQKELWTLLAKAKEAVEASMALLGNATAHFSMERRV